MAKIVELVERIEGEATLTYETLSDGSVARVDIDFGIYRGIEEILVGKAPRDALVIAPRVCGICNHAHLLAAVQAIEEGLRREGVEVTLSAKARDIRTFTWACELIQNHFKWFYMTLAPKLHAVCRRAYDERDGLLKANFVAVHISKALAHFAGQWPHSGYAVPGGVTCDPTYVEVVQARRALDEVTGLVERVFLGMDTARFLALQEGHVAAQEGSDFATAVGLLFAAELADAGKSYDRFMVLADSPLAPASKATPTKLAGVDVRYVREYAQSGSSAKGVAYKQKLYEVGPLARAMVRKEPLVRALHKRYKDGLLTRVVARMHEAVRLLAYARDLLDGLCLDEPSCTLAPDALRISFEGTGCIEAARGSLLHRTVVREGRIVRYEIVTPTQWNLAQGVAGMQGVAEKAMVGCRSPQEADVVFRTFDVCSVCTTQ